MMYRIYLKKEKKKEKILYLVNPVNPVKKKENLLYLDASLRESRFDLIILSEKWKFLYDPVNSYL